MVGNIKIGGSFPGGSGGGGTVVAGSGIAVSGGSTIALGTIPAGDLMGNPGSVAAAPSGVVVGSGLTLTSAGTLNAAAGVVTAVGLGLSLNGGTIAAHQQITLAATAAGTFAITPSIGATSVLVNGPSAGGAVVLTMGSMAVDQALKVIVKQGATAATWVLGTGFVFGTSPSSYTATAVANQFDVIMAISNLGTVADVMAIAQGFTA